MHIHADTCNSCIHIIQSMICTMHVCTYLVSKTLIGRGWESLVGADQSDQESLAGGKEIHDYPSGQQNRRARNISPQNDVQAVCGILCYKV
jgi:hypothetical protein